eukprot:m.147492 g.147492  ORF g.147492 m.147492 type:complete len:636 (+) comp38467_c0_seq25:16-1923(+)
MASRAPRKPVALPYPNCLFAKWIEEWRDQAKREGKNARFGYEKALKSLKKYPLPLHNGQEAKGVISYIGDRLANMLDSSLAKHCAGTGREVQQQDADGRGEGAKGKKRKKKNDVEDGGASSKKAKSQPKQKKKKEYLPEYRSGPYALLVSLFRAAQEENYKGFMTKKELSCTAQQYADASFTVPKPDSNYTAWASMSSLLRKGFVQKYSCPAKFSLTENGSVLAAKLNQFQLDMESEEEEDGQLSSQPALAENSQSDDDSEEEKDEVKEAYQDIRPGPSKAANFIVIDNSSSDSDEVVLLKDEKGKKTSLNTVVTIESSDSESGEIAALSSCITSSNTQPTANSLDILQPGQYEIVLCIDHCEASATERRVQILQELRKNGINCDIRRLNVGDYIWIAKERMSPVPGQVALPDGQELVLDYIVERKRFDDLGKSIIDGRFHEQKARLHECGCSEVIYLIERCHFRKALLGLPEASVNQAIINTQVRDKFMIRRTTDFAETVTYLTLMTRMICDILKGKGLTVCPKEELGMHVGEPKTALMSFKEFNKASLKSKPMTVKDIFLKQLVAINGMSAEKAFAITDFFSTPALLWDAYGQLPSDDEKSHMLAGIRHGRDQRRIGPKLSEQIFKYYCRKLD